MISVKTRCHGGHELTWESQPVVNGRPAGNLLLSGSIFFSGANAAPTLRMLKHINVQTFSLTKVYRFQSCFLVPAVEKVWSLEQRQLPDQLDDQAVDVSADGRCIKLNSITTDRHPDIRKYLDKEEPAIRHFFDIWHISKSVKKKLTAISKSANCHSLEKWIQATSNHLYWCAKASGGDAQLTTDAWLSIQNHVVDIHSQQNRSYPCCLHGPITDGDWLDPDSLAYKKFKEVTGNLRLFKDVAQMSANTQTYALESFHSLLIKFAPKFVAFSPEGMLCRTRLAALHYNENAQRCQAETLRGDLRWKIKNSKAKQRHQVACPVKTAPTFAYIAKLLAEAEVQCRSHASFQEANKQK
ncbi:uncharacterized protein LOC135384551 [Ornithodoros turicata]|uniref:uncharacterized protein LOC135384551 n=1 Tax=Ornithodoros turicata TaxID=34597 RepID=UPI0031391059